MLSSLFYLWRTGIMSCCTNWGRAYTKRLQTGIVGGFGIAPSIVAHTAPYAL